MTVERPCLGLLIAAALALNAIAEDPVNIVAEGETFVPRDASGWQLTHQQDSYASHTYGGMWVTHGAGMGAPAESEGSVATRTVQVPAAGTYRVWSKYQAPAYFNYLHKIEITQKGKTVFAHTYGKTGTDRLWSFSGVSDELWWFWGIDHDAAEGAPRPAALAAGPAEIRLVTVKNAAPAGDRFVDFVILTTSTADDYKGHKPYKVATPFANEALAATELFVRFRNTSKEAAQLSVQRQGHFQPSYGGANTKIPAEPVPPNSWSPWHNIGPFCRLVHNEGLSLTLQGATQIPVQFARDRAGKDVVGDIKIAGGETVNVPLEITWKKDARVRASKDLAADIVKKCGKQWRTANKGKKPGKIAFYGAFRGGAKWVMDLKDALGYNTQLPDTYDHLACDGYHQHAGSPKAISAYAAKIPDKTRFRVLSFGDEIHLGRINFKDPAMQEKFRAWVKEKGYTRNDLGVSPAEAQLAGAGPGRMSWYSQLFNEEERFAWYRGLTEQAKREIGPHVLTGANYSPHTLCQYYGAVYKWVDIFKHNGMSMFWSEDYIFSVPEVPQMISWMFAQMRCGVKYNGQPIHFYVMPHAPGQEPGFLRRNMLLSIGYGAAHIDSFWVAPQEGFTENYVAWGYDDTFRVIHESIYDTGEAEAIQHGGKVRPARVAVVLSKATDFNEPRAAFDPRDDPFTSRCKNADPRWMKQTICRKEQQMLYLALRQAQHAVDLVTEDDIVDGYLKSYDVVYFAGEWIDHRVVPLLEKWVKDGGVLYACGGLGHKNEFGEPNPAMMHLLGLESCKTEKSARLMRTLLELPLAEPIDTITVNGGTVDAIAMKQTLELADADVLGTWSDKSPAASVRQLGKGRAYAVGTLPGTSYMKTALRAVPYARGGRKNLYNPTEFDENAGQLVWLGIKAASLEREVACSLPYVEAIVIDNAGAGSLLTLVNWNNEPVQNLEVRIRLAAAPGDVRSVEQQKSLRSTFKEGVLTFSTDLKEADYILLPKR